MRALRDITAPKVEQLGPADSGEFIYVDISSIDIERKCIVDPKRMPASEAPSRAKQRLRKGDVIVSMTRPNRNAVAIVPPELDGAIGSTGFHVLRAVDDVEPRWIFNAVQTKDFISAMEGLVQGALYPAVRPKDVQSFEIPIPPLKSQIEAVAEIEKQFSRLDEAVANLKRVKANLKRYKAAVLKAAVEGRLVPTEAELARKEGRNYETGEQLLKRILEARRKEWKGKGKYSEPASPDLTALPELPEGWVWASAEQLCSVVASGSTPSPELMMADNGDVPFLKVYNLTFGDSLDFSIKPTFVRRDTHQGQLARSRTLPGDVLMNIVGPPLGKVSIASDLHPEWNINQAIVTFRTLLGFDNRLLASWLLSDPILRRLLKTSKATAGQSNLQVSTCRKIALPLPPVGEQARVIEEVDRRLSLIRNVEVQTDANLKRAERMRQAVLQATFNASADARQ